MIICAGGNENFGFAKPIGIGLVESAINLSKICIEFKPEFLVFIGTCGLYEKDELLQIYLSKTACNVEFAALSKDFYSPLKNEIVSKFDDEKLAFMQKIAQNNFAKNVSYETKINSSNYICANFSRAKEFANLGLKLENMEAFSVLNVAAKFEIPVLCVLCATNFCDENAHKNFVENQAKAKQILENFLKECKLI